MTIVDTIQTVLETIGVHVYYIKRQKETVIPAIVFQDITNLIYGSHAGATDLRKTRFQITCYDSTASKAASLITSVENALAYNSIDFQVAVPLETKLLKYDENTSIYYSIEEYYIFYKI